MTRVWIKKLTLTSHNSIVRCQQITKGQKLERPFHLDVNRPSRWKQANLQFFFLFSSVAVNFKRVFFSFFSNGCRSPQKSEQWAQQVKLYMVFLSRHWKGGFRIGRTSTAALPSKILHLMRNTRCKKTESSEAAVRISPKGSSRPDAYQQRSHDTCKMKRMAYLSKKSTHDLTGGLISQSIKPTGR